MGGCGVFLGTEVTGIYVGAQTLGGPTAAARWMEVQNFCANIAGITAPLITGGVIDRTGNFSAAFVIAAGVAVLGFLAFAFVVRRIERIDSQTESDSSRAPQQEASHAGSAGPRG
jgi:dipeptide/tripeptide permease